MSMNLVTLLYLVASVCFIQALKGLSHPTTSIRGNVFGMTGMTIAVLTTAALIVKLAGSPLGLGGAGAGLSAAVAQTRLSKKKARSNAGPGTFKRLAGAYRLPTMCSGTTHWSNCSAVTWPLATAASRRLLPSWCAFLAI